MQKTRKGTSAVNFNHRPSDQWQINKKAIENFHCDLLSLPVPCVFLYTLVPSVDKIKHDHGCYSLPPTTEYRQIVNPPSLQKESLPEYNLDSELILKCAAIKFSLTAYERDRIEQQTREQSSNSEWFQMR